MREALARGSALRTQCASRRAMDVRSARGFGGWLRRSERARALDMRLAPRGGRYPRGFPERCARGRAQCEERPGTLCRCSFVARSAKSRERSTRNSALRCFSNATASWRLRSSSWRNAHAALLKPGPVSVPLCSVAVPSWRRRCNENWGTGLYPGPRGKRRQWRGPRLWLIKPLSREYTGMVTPHVDPRHTSVSVLPVVGLKGPLCSLGPSRSSVASSNL